MISHLRTLPIGSQLPHLPSLQQHSTAVSRFSLAGVSSHAFVTYNRAACLQYHGILDWLTNCWPQKLLPVTQMLEEIRILCLQSSAFEESQHVANANLCGRCVNAHPGQDQADSSTALHLVSDTQTPSASNATQSAHGTVPSEENEKASTAQPDTASKPNLVSVLKSSRGHAPSKVGSPRSPRQPGSPMDRKTRSGTLQVYCPVDSDGFVCGRLSCEQ